MVVFSSATNRVVRHPVVLVVKDASDAWSKHRTIRFGAGLAYYWLFAFVPLLLVAIFLAGVIFPTEEVISYLVDRVSALHVTDTSDEIARLITSYIEDSVSVQVGIVGTVVAAVSASFALAATQDALNNVWEEGPMHGIHATVRRRLISLGAAVAVASVLVVVLLATAVLGALDALVSGVPVLSELLTVLMSFGVPLLVVFSLVVMLYRWLPDATVDLWSIVLGASCATMAMAIGTRGFWWWVTEWSTPTILGAATAAFLLLAWIYVIAQVFLAGAELTRVVAIHRATPPADRQSSIAEVV